MTQAVLSNDQSNITSYAPFVDTLDSNECQIYLFVTGATCAACIQRIEGTLLSHDYVSYARLNFSSGQLTIRWIGPQSKIDDLVKSIRDLGYGVNYKQQKIQNDETESFLLRCLGVSAFAMGNIMLVSIALWSYDTAEMGVSIRDFLHLIVAAIALPTIAYSGQPFFRSAFAALKHGRTNMDVPISLGVLLACIISLIGLFEHQEHLYFDSAVMLVFFLLMGRYFDARVRQKATSAASSLLHMMVQVATIETTDGKTEIIDARNLRPGMIVRIANGERIPADCEVLTGQSEIDMSLVTGETLPVAVKEGSNLYAGTLNIQSSLRASISKPAADSLLADIVRLVEKAEKGQSFYLRIADRASRLYTPFVHIMALITFVGWYMAGLPFMECLMRATTVLIITCPCALGLAVPVVQVLAVGRLMKMGILVKDGAALEKLSSIDTIIFDKTGTLTYGHPILLNKDQISLQDMKLAASVAASSRHPLSLALVKSYDGPLDDIQVTEVPGSGLQTETGIRLGRAEWCGVNSKSTEENQFIELYLSIPHEHRLVQFLFQDEIRDDAPLVIKELQNQEMGIHILSGDREAVVKEVANKLNIESYDANVRPEDKVGFIETLKEKHKKVLMVGDGLNDTPVLSAATIAMSPSSAIDMAQNAASIIFSGQKLWPIIEAYNMAKDSQIKIKQNFVLAIVYNIFAVPLAVMGLVTPLIAAIAMSSSSLIVIANSFRLRKGKE